MGSPETADSARNLAAMVRVQGPDPKGLKMRNHAFHQYHSGRTSLSASGMVLPKSLYDSAAAERLHGAARGDRSPAPFLVLTVASVVEPFLTLQDRDGISTVEKGRPEFIPGVQIDVMVENGMSLEESDGDSDKGAPSWHSAQCLKLIDVSPSSSALKSLITASFGSLEHEWEIGWSLASLSRGPQSLVTQTQVHHVESGNINQSDKLTTRVAILGVSLFSKAVPDITISPSSRKGDFILAVGSPFGVLSPLHFFNSISVGSIANSYPPRSSYRSLLMADIRCLPGTEGGPVFNAQSQLIGILMRPLRQKNGGAEIQLVIPWEAIATSCSDLLQMRGKELVGLSSAASVEKAVACVCLITVNEVVWASGVLLNDEGLILTNAHLIEPWRFGKRSEDPCIGGEPGGHKWSSTSKGSRKIRVRLDHRDPWIWCEAKVIYVGQGPLDVALLQLESVPVQLCPIIADFSRPAVGSKAYVIGHGLFGPRCGFYPSVCSGVVAKVVQAKLRSSNPLCQAENEQHNVPVMLETTSAVYPGSSGGAVVNLNGHMIGLVTSNARHGGGTAIPHLNFSIPCLALLPIFKFAQDMQDFSLLNILNQQNENLSSVWALMPPISPKPPPVPNLPEALLEGNDKKDVKGSRFAKFIAERQEFLKKNPLDSAGKKPSDIVASKL